MKVRDRDGAGDRSMASRTREVLEQEASAAEAGKWRELRPWQVRSRAVAGDREPQLADLAGDYQVVLRMACGLELHECLQPVKENRPSGASEFKQKQTGHQE